MSSRRIWPSRHSEADADFQKANCPTSSEQNRSFGRRPVRLLMGGRFTWPPSLPCDNGCGYVKSFVYLLTVCAMALGAYWYFGHSSVGILANSEPDKLPTVDASGAPLVKCLRCEGTGAVVCKASRCKNGQVDCPGKCMKLSVGRWEHMDVPGHDPKELWQKYTGSKGWHAWTSDHVGEVIEIRNGTPENIGQCPTCGGKATVLCKVCKGTGTLVCPACRGNKVVRARVVSSATPQITPSRLQTPPGSPPNSIKQKIIRLLDGRTLIGQIIVSDPKVSWIKTSDGKTVEVPTKSIIRDTPTEKE